MRIEKAIIYLLFCLSVLSAQGHEGEQIIVPLTNPDEVGVLTVKINRGSIEVTGYSGDLVIVEVIDKHAAPAETGLKRLSNIGSKVIVEESLNNVTVISSTDKAFKISVRVPKTFSINLSTEDEGNISVQNLEGEMSVSNSAGDVALQNVSGSAFISTIDGKISAFFKNVKEGAHMQFTSVDGAIDVALPENIKALFKMKSDYGEVFSDFELEIEKRKTRSEKNKNGGRKYFLEEWISGTVNGGNAEYRFQSLSGNIYIRKH